MPNDWQKFVDRQPDYIKIPIQEIIGDIQAGNISSYKVLKLTGYKGVYRIRKGKIRILFIKDEGNFKIINVDYRGGVYKNL